jgi:rhomboid family GlyGly-CTERM serine protease
VHGRPPVRIPWITLALAIGGIVVLLAPGAGEMLQYDRSRVLSGEIWRILTGQLAHWTPRMALADLAMVLLLGIWLERSRRGALAAACLGGLVAVGAGIHLLAPEVAVYRGTSGLATTLFVLAVLGAARDNPRPATFGLAVGALGLLAGKLLWEVATGAALAAGDLPPGVTVLPLAHLLGAIAAVPVFALAPGASSPGSRRRDRGVADGPAPASG